ncbi:MAG TPA: ABC transporter permease, partial [Catalimonadaceae bacterium]|nr:ABC transporter permease [Catalimonadaceae bacterium]
MMSFQSEWLKRKGSSASWLTLAGGLFVPVLVLLARLVQYNQTLMDGSSEGAWLIVFNRCWLFMGVFLLPIGIVLAASLIAQIEYRNNTWKQVFASPLTLNQIFWSKFLVVVVMLLMFFLYFNMGIGFAVLVPSVVFPDVPFPKDGIPFWEMFQRNGLFLVLCLPVLGIQYGLSLHIRNFMVPIGFGFALFLTSLIAMSWHFGYLLPYCYTAMEVIKRDNQTDPMMNTVYWALGYFGLATFLNYVAFQFRFGGYKFFSGAFLRLVVASLLVLMALAGLVFGAWKMKNRDAVVAKAIPESREARIQLVESQVGVKRFLPEKSLNPGMEARMAVFGIKGMSIAV